MRDTEFIPGTVYKFLPLASHSKGYGQVQRLMHKTTGELIALAIDTGQFIESALSPFDIYIHVIEGKIETIINGGSLLVNAGEFLIIPGHSRNTSRALEPSKVLKLIMKSGYEQLI